MTAYIFKSSLSLILLFGLYWFLLRKEKLFKFNRFFLILSLVFSLAVPFISIPVNLQKTAKPENVVPSPDYPIQEINTEHTFEKQYINANITDFKKQPSQVDYSSILRMLYISGVIFFLLGFLRNISIIINKIKSSENISFKGYRIVLTREKRGPYCFFRNIFLNKDDYLNGKIDRELLDHELEHVKQHHTSDIIFMELVKIFYWFNPVHLLYDRAIRLNHEYLADHGVISETEDIKSYVEKLLSFSCGRKNMSLTSGSNYSFTRNRLLMMIRSGSGRIIYELKIALTLCMVTFIFILLSFKEIDEKPGFSGTFLPETGMQQNVDKESDLTEDAKPLNGSEIPGPGTVKKSAGLSPSDDDHYLSDKVQVSASQNSGGIGPNKSVDQASSDNKETSQDTLQLRKKDPLIVIDGVVWDDINMSEIDPAKIRAISVLKDASAISKYGDKGKNGVIEIFSREGVYKLIGHTPAKPVIEANGQTVNQSVVYIDGVKSRSGLKLIKPDEISSISVMKNRGAPSAFPLQNKGVIIVTTKNKANAVIAINNISVMYRGVWNPVEIAVPGVTADKVSATITNGTIKRVVKGWEVSPGDLSESVITVWVNDEKVAVKIIKIKDIPDPVPVFAGISNGAVSVNTALEAGELVTELKDFDLDFKFEIVSFNFLRSTDSSAIELTSGSNKLTDEMKSLMSGFKSGQYIVFKDIKAVGPDGKVRDLIPIILRIE